MSLRKNMTVAVIAIVSVTFGAASTLGAQELLHGLSAYDSGWVDFPPGYEVVLAHLVGGDPDDYVVDLQVRDLVDGHGGGHRVHQLGFGGDELNGVYWERLTSSGITVRGWDSEGRIDQFRVRIWVVSDVDYDSGWVGFDAGQDTKWLTHDLGGAVSDYVVDLQFVDFGGKGIHTFGYGRNLMYQVGTWGAAWFRLDLSQVAVHGTNDAYVDNFRLRIFRRPDPAYDSGWVSMTGATYFLPHQLGGPWNDYVVDLQLRDLNDNLGVNQVGYGGDVWDDGAKATVEAHGAYWSHLSGRSITVKRNADDVAADEVRVRIWESRRPKWDSGWMDAAQGAAYTLPHNLGGDPDTFVVDLQFDCTDGCWFGTNQYRYGSDMVFDSGSDVDTYHGAGWYDLTSDEITVVRNTDDVVVDKVRVRLWIAPEPEYDLGWFDPAGLTGPFLFDISVVPGYASEWVVDLQGNDAGTAAWGTNQIFCGTDNFTMDGITFNRVGLAWTRLDSSSITVERAANDSVNARFRLRIWHNMAFDFISPWRAISVFTTFDHNLGADPDSLVLDLHFKDVDIEGIHNLYYGGDRSATNVNDRQGASWIGLNSNAVTVMREAEDQLVDSARMRVWRIPTAAPEIFADGFESGNLSAWSSSSG